MSEYRINILRFNVLNEEVNISFSLEEKDEFHRIYKGNLPTNFPAETKESIEKFVWWSINPNAGEVNLSVNLLKNRKFAKHYFNKILYNHFEEKGVIINRNFINDTEVYIQDHSYNDSETTKYSRFSLRFDNNSLIPESSLLVTYEGDTFILKKNIKNGNLNNESLNRVLYQGRITKFRLLADSEKSDIENIFPVVNPRIREALNLAYRRNFSENKYKRYFDSIQSFFEDHLKGLEINNTIKILSSGFYKPYSGEINHTSEDSNLLLFGNNQKNFIPYVGIKENGQIQGPQAEDAIKFIFIFHEDDREYANKLFSFLKKGYKSFPGLESFVGIDFDIDQDKTIRFSNRDPIPEIKKALEAIRFSQINTYAAIYISQIKKEADDEQEDKVYYQLKELLLGYSITSQVIYKENINNPAFNYFLPNIAIALLAKLGGIPWRLYRPIQNDLVVGIGAKWAGKEQTSYVGSAFCFRNDGSFKEFNVFEKQDTTALASAIKGAIEQYVSENNYIDRLVIHYYKEMSWQEEEPIRKLLKQLNLSVPYVVISINETKSRDYVLFDNEFDGKMPQSGTFIKIRWNEFLLCNNTRYSRRTATRIDGYPFPIKVKIKPYNFEKIDDMQVVAELIDQVYQFSRMYWKSVRQRNMPVTIEYSKLIAGMITNFENKELVPFARNSLWFL